MKPSVDRGLRQSIRHVVKHNPGHPPTPFQEPSLQASIDLSTAASTHRAPTGIVLPPMSHALGGAYIHSEGLLGVRLAQVARIACERFEQLAAAPPFRIDGCRDLPMSTRQAVARTGSATVQRVYELGHELYAARSVAADPVMALVWPLRVSIHHAQGVTTVVTSRPSVMWPELSEAPGVMRVAKQVEGELQRLLRSL